MTAVGERALPRYVTVLAVVLIMAAGIGGAVVLVKSRPKPKREQEAFVAPPVEVIRAQRGDRKALLRLQGTVRPARQLVVVSEVAGRVRWHNRDLVPGGSIKKGEVLLRIDARDYVLAVRQQAAQVANQRLALEVEQGRREVAKREWELFQQRQKRLGMNSDKSTDAPDLVTRKPHLASAKVAVRSARSGLARAQLALSKTSIVAPFNAFVQSENVEIGQLVSPQMQLATLVGTDIAWIQASIPVSQLGYIQFPAAGRKGSKARVWTDTGRGRIERQGRVIRLLGDLEPGGRMARILVEVKQPFPAGSKNAGPPARQVTKAVSSPASTVRLRRQGEASPQPPTARIPSKDELNQKLPLLMGSFVHVEIEGGDLKSVIELPRRALRNDDMVHVVDADERLVIKPVTVVWGTPKRVWLRASIEPGERVVLTQLGAAVAGMKLRVVPKRAALVPSALKPKTSPPSLKR